jgi:hypothetical protein
MEIDTADMLNLKSSLK